MNDLVQVIPKMVKSIHEVKVIYTRTFFWTAAVDHVTDICGFWQTGFIGIFAKTVVLLFCEADMECFGMCSHGRYLLP